MKLRFLPPVPLMLAAVLLAASGLVHGFWTQRWQRSDALAEACKRVADVPLQAGPWTGVAVDVDPEPYRQTRALAYWLRRYTRDGAPGSVTVILMCGQAGHMAVHTPDICYRGAGYEMVGSQSKEQIRWAPEYPAADFWSARFRQSDKAAVSELSIQWSWGAEGAWYAPTSPRWSLGGNVFLYKLYIVHDASSFATADESAREFLKDLMPTLQKALFLDTGAAP